MKSLLTIIVSCLAAGAIADAPLVITPQTPVHIVTAATPTPTAALAAEELRRALQISLGSQPILNGKDRPDEAVVFHVGPGTGETGIDTTAMAWDHFRMRRQGKQIHLIGRDDERDPLEPHFQARTGTLYAVYAFLREYVGMRRLWESASGEIIPRHAQLVLPAFDLEEGPAFPIRGSYYGHGRLYGGEALKTRVKVGRFNGMGTSLIGSVGHASEVVMGDRYFEEHPEYYALVNGERRPMAWLGGRGKICHSNPDVPAIFAAWGAQSDQDYFSISPNDSSGWCECDDCRALDGPQPEDGILNISGRIFTFANRVAREARKLGLESVPAIYAYSAFLEPPAEIPTLEDNLMLFVARGIAWNTTPSEDRHFRQLIDAWGKRTSRFCLRDYRNNAIPMILYPYPRRMAADIRYLADSFDNFMGISAAGDDTRAAALWGPTDYVASRLLWNPELQVESILDDFYRSGWPTAHRRIRAYFDLYEDRVNDVMASETTRLWPWRAGDNLLLARKIYTPEIMQQGKRLLEEASQLAASDDERVRVDFLKTGWEAVMIDLEYYAALMRVVASGDGMLQIVPEPDLHGVTIDRATKIRLLDDAQRAIDRRQSFLEKHRDHGGLPTAVLATRDLRFTSSWHRTVADLRKLYLEHGDNTTIFSEPWHFQIDPEAVGAAEGWWKEAHDTSTWDRISGSDFWENQGYGADRYPATRGYNGWGWYAREIVLPERGDYQDIILTLGAVDESYDLYVNGTLLKSFRYDSLRNPDSWREAQLLSIASAVRWGATNRITVAVLDKSGNGGIWKTSYCSLIGPNLLSDEIWRTPGEGLDVTEAEEEGGTVYRLTAAEIGRLHASHPVTPGSRYTIGMQVKCLSTQSSAPVSIRVVFKSADGATVTPEHYVGTGTKPEQLSAETWTNLSRSFAAPPGAVSMQLTLFWRQGTYLARNLQLQQL